MSDKMGFLWAVTTVVWVGTVVLMVMLVGRQTRLQKELKALEQTLQDTLE